MMKKLIFVMALLLVPCFALADVTVMPEEGTADPQAAAAAPANLVEICDLHVPNICEIDCVELTIRCGDCCCEGGPSCDNIMVELLDCDSKVLGTAMVPGPWCECGSKTTNWGSLDNPVDPCMVGSIRITKPGDDGLCVRTMKLELGNWDDCKCKGKFKKAADFCYETVLGNGAGETGGFLLY
jgi:hypothetical protein